MEQLVLDIASAKDATLIKELLKRFKGVEVNDFSTSMTTSEMRRRIEEGLKDADAGHVKSWREVKNALMKQIALKSK